MQSNMKDIQKDMLLYWSGEADETTMRRVTECLERDPRTRSYLEDLHEMDTEFKSSKKTLPVEFQLVERGFWMKSSTRRLR